MNNILLKRLYKYIIILIVLRLLFTPWPHFFIEDLNHYRLIESIQLCIDILLSILIGILLLIDCLKIKVPLGLLSVTVVVGCVYPILGVVIFSLLFLSKDSESIKKG